MKLKSILPLTFCILLLYSSNGVATTCEKPYEAASHINSLSFIIPEIEGPLRFTIFDFAQTTKFHLTIFYNYYENSPNHIPGISIHKIDFDNCLSDDIIPTEVKPKGFSIGDFVGAVEGTFILVPGEYYIKLHPIRIGFRSPHTEHYQDYGSAILMGNTGQHGIDPCEHLFIYPSQSQQTSQASNTQNKFYVVSPSNCNWEAKTADEWITITHGKSENGTGYVEYTVAKNPLEQTRKGTISIWNKVFQVEQEAHKTYLPFIPLLMNNGPK